MDLPWAFVKSYAELLWRLVNLRRLEPRTPNVATPGPAVPASPSKIPQTEKRVPLFAIIIGINKYEDSSLSELFGSVPDAQAIFEYLRGDLKVPSDQITLLCNHDASRAKILDAFQKLKDNKRIQKDDPILIYYAGHGGEVVEAGHTIQVIFPQDYNPPTVKAIRDRHIGALLDGLADIHGNNITVIFDCCHSGSGTRGNDTTAIVRGAPLTVEGIPRDDDPEMRVVAGTRGIKVANGFTQHGIRSHVLLAACSANEEAREDASERRGRFTVALLKLLRNTGAEQLVYADVLCRIEPIVRQNPQCEGLYRTRTFFDAKVPSPARVSYEVKLENGKYILQAGSAHGVTKGAEFTIYKDKDAIVAEDSLAVMTISETVSRNGVGSISAFTTMLLPPPGLPEHSLGPQGLALAVQTKIGAAEDFLLHVPIHEECRPIFDAVVDELQGTGPNPCRVTLVPREKAQMEMLFDQTGFTLATLDPRLVKYGISRLAHTLKPNVDAAKMRRVLRAAAHYTFNLSHNQANTEIGKKVDIQLKQLVEKPDEWDDSGYPLLTPDTDNLVQGDRVDFVPEEDGIYGFEITNDTAWDLYFICLYFDCMDLSISELTPVANRSGQYRQDDFKLTKKGGRATIGYGPSAMGTSPISFVPIPQGLDASAGFFKFYFSTELLDLSHVPQTSPFHDTRSIDRVSQKPRPTWGTITLPVIQRRAEQQ
ncbi:caspase domain-containing protein [Coprinopsis sp. MPI-PUGE-AT-0042]|nr:caspase domain-containing protein [Coprinopsis sp. MPI-PUGE-AT-0042]